MCLVAIFFLFISSTALLNIHAAILLPLSVHFHLNREVVSVDCGEVFMFFISSLLLQIKQNRSLQQFCAYFKIYVLISKFISD